MSQTQLMCIVRAILRKRKNVVINEATVNINMEIERILQNTLALVIDDSTIITVVRRIKPLLIMIYNVRCWRS